MRSVLLTKPGSPSVGAPFPWRAHGEPSWFFLRHAGLSQRCRLQPYRLHLALRKQIGASCAHVAVTFSKAINFLEAKVNTHFAAEVCTFSRAPKSLLPRVAAESPAR